MRAALSCGSFGWLAILLPVVSMACAESGAASDPPATTSVAPTTPAPDAGTLTDAADAADSAKPPKNACKLRELTDVADVTPSFVMHAPPATVPPAMTGGTLAGEYRVDKATVFLPSGSAGLVDPKKTTGTVNAWAIFEGTNYRLRLKADFLISSVAGPQAQGADTASQGAFTVSSAVLTLDHACDTALANEADYSFTDMGGGRATILIKTPSPYGDTYLELDAAKH